MKNLKIHTLEKGWQDRDEIMLHALFQILVDFVVAGIGVSRDWCHGIGVKA